MKRTASSTGTYACGDDGNEKIGLSGFCNQHRGTRKKTPKAMWIDLDRFFGAVRMLSYFKKFLIIILLFCHPSFGNEECSYQNLKPQDIEVIKTKIYDGVYRTITRYLDGRDILIQEGPKIPVSIFEEMNSDGYRESFVSTSYSLITKKNQTLCHSYNNIECYFNDKFSLFFYLGIERDNEGIPIKKYCAVYSTIYLNIVNITQNYPLEGLAIFGGYRPVHMWDIPISSLDEDLN